MLDGPEDFAVVQVLQWVRRLITPVMAVRAEVLRAAQETSMGPASDNAGYAAAPTSASTWATSLQWVRRLITPVMDDWAKYDAAQENTSMGPASDNAGYVAG